MGPSKIHYIGFFSKYPYKKESRANKKILYEGSVKDVPAEYVDHIQLTDDGPHKLCIIHENIEKDDESGL